MTNQEAISWLRTIMSDAEQLCECEKEAIKMAIEALERLIIEEPKARANGKMVLDSIRYHHPCSNCVDYMYYGNIHCEDCGRYKEYFESEALNDD